MLLISTPRGGGSTRWPPRLRPVGHWMGGRRRRRRGRCRRAPAGADPHRAHDLRLPLRAAVRDQARRHGMDWAGATRSRSPGSTRPKARSPCRSSAAAAHRRALRREPRAATVPLGRRGCAGAGRRPAGGADSGAAAERGRPGGGARRPRDGATTSIVVRHYQADDSIFLGHDYLIKGVAGAIFWKLVREHPGGSDRVLQPRAAARPGAAAARAPGEPRGAAGAPAAPAERAAKARSASSMPGAAGSPC